MCQSDFPAYRGQMEYVCLHCGQRYPGDSLLYTCPSCGGVFLLENTKFDELKQRSGAEWREIFDRRASTRSTALRGIFRYYELLAPLLDEEDIVYLGEGLTPIVEAAPALRDRVGVPFAYKNDGQNPSASFKDRGMACAFSYLKWLCRRHQWDEVLTVCASTGDTSAAAALYASYVGAPLKSVVLLPHGKGCTLLYNFTSPWACGFRRKPASENPLPPRHPPAAPGSIPRWSLPSYKYHPLKGLLFP